MVLTPGFSLFPGRGSRRYVFRKTNPIISCHWPPFQRPRNRRWASSALLGTPRATAFWARCLVLDTEFPEDFQAFLDFHIERIKLADGLGLGMALTPAPRLRASP